MRKVDSFDIEEFLKETIGEEGIKELGLALSEEDESEYDGSFSSKEITQEEKNKIFISHSEWLKLKLPFPTF